MASGTRVSRSGKGWRIEGCGGGGNGGLTARHNYFHSRRKAGAAVDESNNPLAPHMRAEHPVVRTSASGRPALFVGAHTQEILGMGEASAVKVFGTELTQQVTRELLEVLGAAGSRSGDQAPLRGALESAYRTAVINTFGGGANEIQRDIIAMAGLGMPRAPREARPTETKEGSSTQ